MRDRWAVLLGAMGWVCVACEPGGVGDPCTPEDEWQPTFSGFKETEVNVESRSFQCQTRVCLVNHFKGRVSCPYGQTLEDIATRDGTDPRRCRIPGTDGSDPIDEVTVPVPAQLYARTATASPRRTGQGRVDDAVYCSCRCANAHGKTDDGASYCTCPSGFSCTQLIDTVGLGSAELAGSYCIRDGTEFLDGSYEPCSGTACGNDGANP
jgi:hypothetical protein